jgi:shikimate kinase
MKETPRIVVTGFMGAGKTAVARELARSLGCDALDLDEFITEREGRGPRALIDEEGEAAFREIESLALADALKTKARVVALGGGAWTIERNRAALRAEPDCFTVWLDAPFELCWERITGERGGEGRPLGREREAARRLFEERLASYRLAAFHVRVTAGESAEQLAARIIAAVS